jgi:hypothetical protein
MKNNVCVSSERAAFGINGTPAAEIGTIAFNFLYIFNGVVFFILPKY